MEKKKGFFSKVSDLLSFKTKEIIKYVGRRGYDAGKQSNSNLLWDRVATTEDSEIYKSLEPLRARSRDLAQNNPIMKHYLMMMDNNIVGKDGFKNQILGEDTNGKLDINGNKAVADAWLDWCKKENCDVSEKLSFKQQCSVIAKNVPKDGEILIKFVREKSNERNQYGFKIQLLDPERLDLKLNKDLPDGYIRMSVEVDFFGRPRAYWLRKFSVKDNSYMSGTLWANDYERVPAEDILHLFMPENPEQTRGVPWAHAVMIYMKDLDDFNQACLLAAKVGAASSIYLEREKGIGNNDLADEVDEDGNFVQQMGFGEIRTLPVGATMKSFDGKYPSDAYQIYTKRLLQSIAGGVGLSQVFLGNDTEDLNYSTARTVILEERNYYQNVQQWLIENFLDKVYQQWLAQALLNGKITYTNNKGQISKIGFDKYNKFLKHKFIGRRWPSVDELKEATATQLDYENMRKPLSVILAERGLDLAEVAQQYKQDEEILNSILGADFKLISKDDKTTDNATNVTTNTFEQKKSITNIIMEKALKDTLKDDDTRN